MIQELCPRCPISDQEFDLLRKQVNEYFYTLHKNGYSYDDCLRLSWERFPLWGKYKVWKNMTDGIVEFSDKSCEIEESEYELGTKDWNEYNELKHQLIYVQNLSYDSPEWQAVIEKYRRKKEK